MDNVLLSELRITPQLEGDADDPELGFCSNVDRAEAALVAVKAFHKRMFGLDEDAETVISDMVADLIHLCRLSGIDWDAVLERGMGHHSEEVRIAKQL